ncbi:hypothetical protein O6H91_03G091800 [Diphasiastrum complanatum]|uniref:Uncharacterized protein n=1 Tax=Diphasiastrum complanatum TaxID=34168 RepID=A0ACC2E9G8_DIPCM|nr:hypothetical protein O6H91_03G091800 [Diphasiastrum complanatum]
MGPKKKHNTNKSSKSSSSARASKGAAKVQLSAENESKLRRLLQNNSNFNTNTANSSEPSAGASLEISTDGQRKQIEKRLKNIYDALCSEGFDSSQIERVLAALPMGQQTLESALDWLCFNLSSEELPRKFSSGLTASALEGESVQLLSVARHDWTSAERSDEVDISLEKYIILNPRERKDDKQESNAGQADWIRQYVAQEAEDNDAESSKSEGSSDLEPQFIDPVTHAKEVKTELFLAKQAAADAKKAGDKDKQTTASYLIRKLRKELASLGIADDDAHGTKEMDKTENERWRRLSEGIVHDVDTFPSLSIDGGAEGSSSFIPAGANNQVGDAGPRPTRSTPQVTFSGNSNGVGQQAKGANVALDLNSDSLETKVEKSSSTESGKKETGFEGVNRCEDPEATLDGDEMLTLFEEETSNMGSLPQTVVESQKRDKFIPWGTEGSTSKKDLVVQGRKGSKATSQPKAVLQQQCQKMGWLAPQYQRVGGDIDKAIYAVTVVRTTSGRGKNKVAGGPITFSLPTNEEAFSSILEAQNAVAAWALCQLFSELPLYRLLQEPFRSMCLRWHVEAKELQDKEAENQGLRRESFLKSLVNSTSINIPNQNTASEDTSKLVDTADKKLEDSMVTTSHLLHKHQDGESESAKEANSQYLLSLMHNKMRNKKYKEMAQSRNSLPIAAIKEQLLKVLVQGDVVVVSGETGSGKTTQVPQFILDEMIMNGCGGFCNIICTQPRRIAAISVAERVAAERCEPGPGENGSLIGYQVRLHTAWNQKLDFYFALREFFFED